MINLRYHIVSLTAVFLAFGLGILAGTTVIDQGLVTQLRSNTTALEKNLNDLRAQVAALDRQIDVWERFGDTVVPRLLPGRLAGRAVVVLADRGVPGDLAGRLAETFRLAGAKPPTRITFTGKWALSEPAALEQLALALGVQATTPASVLSEAAQRLASRLGGSADARDDADLVRGLEEAGFLDVAGLPDTGSFPAANALIVVLTSGTADSPPPEEAFFLPFVRVLSAARIVAVAEPLAAEDSLAERVRGDRALARAVTTVDHVDTPAGLLSLVYGLRDLGAGRVASHYGLRGGAKAVAPDLGTA